MASRETRHNLPDTSTWTEPVWSSSLAGEIDRAAASRFLIHPLCLMETAGRSVGELVYARYSERPRSVLVLAGCGNNGGDALVAARYLLDRQVPLQIILVGTGKRSDACQEQYDILKSLGHEPLAYSRGRIDQSDDLLIIDGVFGLGFRAPMPEEVAGALTEAAAASPRRFVVAVDIPSGLDPDAFSGACPLVADLTVTFGGKKACHLASPARDHCGEVVTCEIGFPRQAINEALAQQATALLEACADELLAFEPWSLLPASAHKYDRGHVLVLGGSPGKYGAPQLSGLAALRAGAGWVTLGLPESASAAIAKDLTQEFLFKDDASGQAQLDATLLQSFLETRKVKAVIIGPGLMSSPFSADVLKLLCTFSKKHFCIIDAGAVHELAGRLTASKLQFDPFRTVLTPHPGEWEKLFEGKIPAPQTLQDLGKARTACASLGINILLKTATPIWIGATGPAIICTSGHVGLAKAGTGDVLAGVIAAHVLAGLPLSFASTRAYSLLALTAVDLTTSHSLHGLMPSDLINAL